MSEKHQCLLIMMGEYATSIYQNDGLQRSMSWTKNLEVEELKSFYQKNLSLFYADLII